ncbi:hypothetical protein G4O51_01535 [Candidatus Bathyarchaeota archaeon A05DMB-2]|nr:hypothetical protein [Candidatus Bathyarchaeota archaeon A05DMB-2]
MEVNIMKKYFIIPTALFLMIGILLVPLASAATYYISSVHSYGTYGAGTVSNPSNITGSSPNNAYARIRGVSSSGDGGYIIGLTNAAVPAGSTVKIYAFSAYGYYSRVHVYVSYYSDGPWYEVGSGLTVSSGPDWYNFGYTTQNYRYVAVASIYEGGQPTDVYIDCVQITT